MKDVFYDIWTYLYKTKDLERFFYIDAMTGEIVHQGDFEPCTYDY